MTPPPRIVSYGIAVAMLLIGLYYAINSLTASFQFFGKISDLPEFYAGALLFSKGELVQAYHQPSIFSLEHTLFPTLADRGVMLFLPPPAIALLTPLALLDARTVVAAWAAVLSVCVGVSLLVLWKWLRPSLVGLAWIGGLLLISGPLNESLKIGQLAPLMLAAFCASSWLAEKQRWGWAGFLLSVLILKPQQLLPFFVYLFGSCKYRYLGWAAGFIVLYALVSLPHFGLDGYQAYVSLIKSPANLVYMQPQLNPTVRGQLMLAVGSATQLANLVAVLFMMFGLLLCMLLGRKFKDSPRWLYIGLAAAMPVGLVTSLHCHDYDLLLLVPGMVALLLNKIKLPAVQFSKPACVVLIGALTAPVYAEVHYTYLLHGGTLNPYFFLLAIFALATVLRLLRTDTAADAEANADANPGAKF